jgi:hypothetical protein
MQDATVPKIKANDFMQDATEEVGSGSDSRKIYPQLENNKYLNVDGKLYYVSGSTIDDKMGDDETVYTLVNVLTGANSTIRAMDKGVRPSNVLN